MSSWNGFGLNSCAGGNLPCPLEHPPTSTLPLLVDDHSLNQKQGFHRNLEFRAPTRKLSITIFSGRKTVRKTRKQPCTRKFFGFQIPGQHPTIFPRYGSEPGNFSEFRVGTRKFPDLPSRNSEIFPNGSEIRVGTRIIVIDNKFNVKEIIKNKTSNFQLKVKLKELKVNLECVVVWRLARFRDYFNCHNPMYFL